MFDKKNHIIHCWINYNDIRHYFISDHIINHDISIYFVDKNINWQPSLPTKFFGEDVT